MSLTLSELASPPQRRLRRAAWLVPAVAGVAGMAVVLTVAAIAIWRACPDRVSVNFIAEHPYFEATIYLDGEQRRKPNGTPYTTPCTIDNLTAEVHHVVFKRDGSPDWDVGEIDFAQVRQITISWNRKP